MEIDAWQLQVLIREAAKEAVAEFARHLEPSKDEITYSQACKEFGEGWLDHQIAIGAAKWFRKGVYKNSPSALFTKRAEGFKRGAFKSIEKLFLK